MKKLTVSVVGGGTGGRLSLEAVVASEFYELVALADLRPEVGAELGRRYSGLRTFTDFHEMFQVSRRMWSASALIAYSRSRGAGSLENANQADSG